MVRVDRVHTGGGDEGETSLVDGSRVSKSNLRLEVVGTIDELNSLLGIVAMEARRIPELHVDGRAKPVVIQVMQIVNEAIARIQQELFDIGAELACPKDNIPEEIVLLGENSSNNLLEEMNVWLEELEPLTSFILPSGDGPVALLQLARTVVRRLERRLVELNENEGIRDFTLVYCNRLSDWCFVLARWITHRLDGTEVLWRPIGERSSSEANRTLIQRDHTNIDDVLEEL